MKCVVAIAIAALLCGSAAAGDVRFTWTESPGASGYRIYVNDSVGQVQADVLSGESHAKADVPAGTTEWVWNAAPDGCVQQFAYATAYNWIGESAPRGRPPAGGGEVDDPVDFFARPILVGDPQRIDETVFMVGGNFAPTVLVRFDTVEVTPARADCMNISVPVAMVPTIIGGVPVLMSICNDTVCMSRPLLPASKPSSFAVQ